MADVSPPQHLPVADRRLPRGEYLRLATETLHQARQLPIGAERNEMRQVALSLVRLARGVSDRGDGVQNGAI